VPYNTVEKFAGINGSTKVRVGWGRILLKWILDVTKHESVE